MKDELRAVMRELGFPENCPHCYYCKAVRSVGWLLRNELTFPVTLEKVQGWWFQVDRETAFNHTFYSREELEYFYKEEMM